MNDFLKKNREPILIAITLIIGSFLIFYWTYSYFSSKETELKNKVKTVCYQVKKAEELYNKIKIQPKYTNRWKSGILNLFQKMGKDLSISNKIVSIRPKQDPNFSEIATVRIENVGLDELVRILKYVENYSNLRITSFTLNKSFTDPTKGNIVMDVGKINAT